MPTLAQAVQLHCRERHRLLSSYCCNSSIRHRRCRVVRRHDNFFPECQGSDVLFVSPTRHSVIDGVPVIPVGTLRHLPTGSRTENSGGALTSAHRQRPRWSFLLVCTDRYLLVLAQRSPRDVPLSLCSPRLWASPFFHASCKRQFSSSTTVACPWLVFLVTLHFPEFVWPRSSSFTAVVCVLLVCSSDAFVCSF